jgi:hypothetical protein
MARDFPEEVAPGGTGSLFGDLRGTLNSLLVITKSIPALGKSVTQTIIDGNLSIGDAGDILVAVQTGVVDTLDTFTDSDIPDGRGVMLRAADPAKPILVTHLANDGAGIVDGKMEIVLRGADGSGFQLSMDELLKSVTLQRRGNQMVEIARFGFAVAGTIGSADQDFKGFKVVGATLGIRAVSTDYVATIQDVGWVLKGWGRIVLPEPSSLGLDETAIIGWRQTGAEWLFFNHLGQPPQNPYNHDRGAGPYAFGSFQVVEDDDGNLVWAITGMTKSADEGGGGGGGGGGTAITREWMAWESAVDVAIPSSSISPVSLGSGLTHTPSDGDWIYFASFGVNAAGSTSNTALQTRVLQGTTTVSEVLRGRYSTHYDHTGMLWGRTYSGATSQTFRMEAQHSATGYAGTVYKPAIHALKLDTANGEGYAFAAGPTNSSSNTYLDALTMTKTTSAEDYILIAFSQYDTPVTSLADARITVDGVEHAGATVSSSGSTGYNSYFVVCALTLTAASHTFKIQIRRNVIHTSGTFNMRNSTMVLLRKSRFEQANVYEAEAEASHSSSTPSVRINASVPVKTGWRSLLIASSLLYIPNHSTTIMAKARLQRNGTSLVRDALHGTRDDDGSWGGNQYAAVRTITPQLGTDVFTMDFASADNAAIVKSKQVSLAVLALSPA